MAPRKRQSIGPYDKDGLKEGLKNHVKNHGAESALKLGVYDSLNRARAVSATGLLYLSQLVTVILESCPAAEVHVSVLKETFQDLGTTYTTLPGTMALKNWAGWITERIITVLNHLRRIKLSKQRYLEASGRLTAKDKAALDELLKKIKVERIAAARSTSKATSPKKRSLKPTASVEASPPKRTLKPTTSLDSDGWPVFGSLAVDAGIAESVPAEPKSSSSEAPRPSKLKKPAASKAVPMKKPSGILRRHQYDKMSQAQKLKARPNGCSKCRRRPGCCRSCIPP